LRYLIGLGNYTAFDDSVGVRLIEHVVSHGLERGFRAIDLGANPLNLVAYLDPATTAILLVDAAHMGLAPGDTKSFWPDEVVSAKKVGGLTTHEGDVLKIVEIARAAGQHVPRLAFFGIEPALVKNEIGLSKILTARLGAYAHEAIACLLQL
jgi:hydrogenase maturation protease